MPNTREKLIEQAEDILSKWDFFYGQMAGRELWADKPKEVQDKDIEDFCRDLSIVRSAIANGVTVQKWIPVTERLPDKDGKYLVCRRLYGSWWRETLNFAKDARKVSKYDFHRGWKNVWYWYDSEWGHLTMDDVTHWMPLPQPPKGE